MSNEKKGLRFVGTVEQFRLWTKLLTLECDGKHESIQAILDCKDCKMFLGAM